jgi:hypothetical protein
LVIDIGEVLQVRIDGIFTSAIHSVIIGPDILRERRPQTAPNSGTHLGATAIADAGPDGSPANQRFPSPTPHRPAHRPVTAIHAAT